VVANLLGVAAEIGVLTLTKNRLAASVLVAPAGAAVKYLVEELDLKCTACGTVSPVKQEVADGEPAKLHCGNQQCALSAFLLVTAAQQLFEQILRQAEERLPPTCLLMRGPATDDGITLIWRSHNATSAALNGESVPVSGSTVISPEDTTVYLLEVIGKYGRSEHSVTVEVAKQNEESDDETDDGVSEEAVDLQSIPPPPISPPSPPVRSATRIRLEVRRILVLEDGSLGANDWSFEIFFNERNLLTLPKQSYHDNERRASIEFQSMFVDDLVEGNEIRISVKGYDFDNRRNAYGSLGCPSEALTQTIDRNMQVAVPGNPKNGSFVFWFSISKTPSGS
jgi:hypothetical protein